MVEDEIFLRCIRFCGIRIEKHRNLYSILFSLYSVPQFLEQVYLVLEHCIRFHDTLAWMLDVVFGFRVGIIGSLGAVWVTSVVVETP